MGVKVNVEFGIATEAGEDDTAVVRMIDPSVVVVDVVTIEPIGVAVAVAKVVFSVQGQPDSFTVFVKDLVHDLVL